MTTSAPCRSLLVLGGARSGKSRYAQRLAETSGRAPILVATATAGDGEMAERIARHRADRDPAVWSVVEEPLALAGAVRRAARPNAVLVVDCLTLWLSNLMCGADDPAAEADLAEAVRDAAGPVILVSNEIGLGLVPETPLGRAFRDRQGRLNQRIAEACDAVVFVAAGLPLALKPPAVLPVLADAPPDGMYATIRRT